jgi:hypothetical protein
MIAWLIAVDIRSALTGDVSDTWLLSYPASASCLLPSSISTPDSLLAPHSGNWISQRSYSTASLALLLLLVGLLQQHSSEEGRDLTTWALAQKTLWSGHLEENPPQ